MEILRFLVHTQPGLKKKLKMARIKKTPEEFILQTLRATVLFSVLFAFIVFLFTGKSDSSPVQKMVLMIFVLFVSAVMCYNFFLKSVDAEITKRSKAIDREVIFAGRFLLVKLEAGVPLFNALIEGSKSYGVAAKFFKEIVDDITLGTPLEEALENAMIYTPSKKFGKILFQINNALRLGIDVTKILKAILEELISEEKMEIKAYGKKLSSVAMFYMLAAIVLPSLGMTMLVIVLGFMSIPLGFAGYTVICVFISFIQIFFMIMFKSMRPNVNL